MFTEDQLLPISALQHLIFCERQAALIHVERLWAENRLTVEGQNLHQKAHQATTNHVAQPSRGTTVRIARGLMLRSLQLGLAGQADIVEFHLPDCGHGNSSRTTRKALHEAIRNPLAAVVPVEYKRGQPKKDHSDSVQLCAQALCLEETLNVAIPTGHLFYGKRKRRTEVPLDQSLRDRTHRAIVRLREMIDNRETPPATRQPKCDSCSLVELCLPDAMRLATGARQFNQRQLAACLASDAGPATDDPETP